MNKLSFFNGIRSTPNTWQPCHVTEIVDYLYSRGFCFAFYKLYNGSKFIICIDNVSIFFKSCQEICSYLIDYYFAEKEEEEREFFASKRKRIEKKYFIEERTFKL